MEGRLKDEDGGTMLCHVPVLCMPPHLNSTLDHIQRH